MDYTTELQHVETCAPAVTRMDYNATELQHVETCAPAVLRRTLKYCIILQRVVIIFSWIVYKWFGTKKAATATNCRSNGLYH